MRSPRRFARRFCAWSVPPYGGFGDFGPTPAAEKLCERDRHRISGETLRRWMIADGLWQARQRRPARIHQHRPRRPCRGDLVQVDGSPHDWFEGRGPRCTLIVFIDDATGELMALRFAAAETTQAYMETLRTYLSRHGRPVALYSDRRSIFRAAFSGSIIPSTTENSPNSPVPSRPSISRRSTPTPHR